MSATKPDHFARITLSRSFVNPINAHGARETIISNISRNDRSGSASGRRHLAKVHFKLSSAPFQGVVSAALLYDVPGLGPLVAQTRPTNRLGAASHQVVL